MGGIEVAIVADDLTGAADCAAAFAAAGRPWVLLQPGTGAVKRRSGRDVVAVSSNSRDRVNAATDVAAAVNELAAMAPRVWFKKIDSTLRGPIGAELRTMIEMLSPALTIVCPAFPAMGRTVREGHVHVHGEPLQRTQLWADFGGGEAGLPELLELAGLRALHVDLPEIRGAGLAALLNGAQDGTVLVVDAETDNDLGVLIAACRSSQRALLWVGSAGLAGALADALSPGTGAPPAAAEHRIGCEAVLVVAGSASAQTQRQLADLEQRCGAKVALLPVAGLLARDPATAGQVERALETALTACGDAALAIEPPLANRAQTSVAATLAQRLGELTGRFASHFDGLVLTGGDTARGVLLEIGVGGLEVTGSVESGVPASRSVEGNLRVVTKAGAFGDDQTLSRAVRYLHEPWVRV